MDCQHVREVTFLFIDQEMEDDQVGPFQSHVDGCGHCADEVAYTRRFLLVVRERCVRHSAPPRLRQRILISFPHRSSAGNGTVEELQ